MDRTDSFGIHRKEVDKIFSWVMIQEKGCDNLIKHTRRRLLLPILTTLVVFVVFLFAVIAFYTQDKMETSVSPVITVGEAETSVILVSEEPEVTPLPEEPEPEPVFEEYDITLMALGDNLMHMGIVNTGRQPDRTYDYTFLFEPMRPFLQAADIKVINQETILGGNELGFSGYPHFNSPTQVGDAIADAGFNIVLHASNHAYDQGIRGIDHAIDYWSQYPDILTVGINRADKEPEIPLLNVGGYTFAILNYTYGPNLGSVPGDLRGRLNMLCDYDESSGLIDFTSLHPGVIRDIAAAREIADIVIVFPHWGTEYTKVPSSYQKKFAMMMTEAGADLIIGTHPHVPQPIEWITAGNGNKALCYYSLGNYVSTQKKALCMLEGMAWVSFHVSEEGIALSEEKTGIIPLVCHYKSGPVRLEQVYLLEDYTEEMAARHGIRQYGGVTLRLSDLQADSDEIFGEFVRKRSDIIPDTEPSSNQTNQSDF